MFIRHYTAVICCVKRAFRSPEQLLSLWQGSTAHSLVIFVSQITGPLRLRSHEILQFSKPLDVGILRHEALQQQNASAEELEFARIEAEAAEVSAVKAGRYVEQRGYSRNSGIPVVLIVFTGAPSILGHEHGDAVIVLDRDIMRIAVSRL